MLLTMCCQKRLCQRRRVSLCMLVRAHRRAEGEQGAFRADPGEFGFLLTEDLYLNAFFPQQSLIVGTSISSGNV